MQERIREHQKCKNGQSRHTSNIGHTRHITNTRRVWRYQRGNQDSYIEEEQTTQWPREKLQKDIQRSTNKANTQILDITKSINTDYYFIENKKILKLIFWFCGFMVFNITFNNISVISRQSVLLTEDTGVPGENHWTVASHWQTLSHNTLHPWARFKLTISVVIGTDCIGSCKSNYHAITATTASNFRNYFIDLMIFNIWPLLRFEPYSYELLISLYE